MRGPPAARRRRFRVRAAHALAKDGGGCEDHWAAREEAGRFALCDGASEGWDGGGWARCLSLSLSRWAGPVQATRCARAAFRPAGGEDEGWLVSMAKARGSWSTALVVSTGRLGLSLEARAVGDSCLFVLDGLLPVLSFPLASEADFGMTPELIGAAAEGLPDFLRLRVPLARLDRPAIVLASDALAARFLRADFRHDREAWSFLRRADAASFSVWAKAETAAGRLRTDDLCLVWVEA